MFTFFEKVDAKYEKLFFDHTMININNETIDLNQYKGKTILLVKLKQQQFGFAIFLNTLNLKILILFMEIQMEKII